MVKVALTSHCHGGTRMVKVALTSHGGGIRMAKVASLLPPPPAKGFAQLDSPLPVPASPPSARASNKARAARALVCAHASGGVQRSSALGPRARARRAQGCACARTRGLLLVKEIVRSCNLYVGLE